MKSCIHGLSFKKILVDLPSSRQICFKANQSIGFLYQRILQENIKPSVYQLKLLQNMQQNNESQYSSKFARDYYAMDKSKSRTKPHRNVEKHLEINTVQPVIKFKGARNLKRIFFHRTVKHSVFWSLPLTQVLLSPLLKDSSL